MSYFLYALYTLLYFLLLIWGLRLWLAASRLSTALLLAVTFGVFYDNLILALGNVIGASALLWGLSLPRFLLHQLLLPWLILAMVDLARQAGHPWTQSRVAWWGGVLASALVMLAGAATRLAGLTLEPAVLDGVMRYVAVGVSGPPIVSIVSVGFAGIAGIAFWRHDAWPWITLAVLLAFFGEIIPDEAWRRAVGSAFELLLMAVLFLTQQRLDRCGVLTQRSHLAHPQRR
ncbi:MAG: hypothetical protein WAU00_21365 [Caldilinea sp.]